MGIYVNFISFYRISSKKCLSDIVRSSSLKPFKPPPPKLHSAGENNVLGVQASGGHIVISESSKRGG